MGVGSESHPSMTNGVSLQTGNESEEPYSRFPPPPFPFSQRVVPLIYADGSVNWVGHFLLLLLKSCQSDSRPCHLAASSSGSLVLGAWWLLIGTKKQHTPTHVQILEVVMTSSDQETNPPEDLDQKRRWTNSGLSAVGGLLAGFLHDRGMKTSSAFETKDSSATFLNVFPRDSVFL